jgi:leucyl aminopeptidase
MDGTSIEVIHTDAEGRMLLADTLALARKSKPKFAIDFATLTGACPAAIDTRRSGIFSNREELAAKAVKVGEACGERVCSFPIGEDYKEPLKSEVADILQCTQGNSADQIYGATFLAHFIGDETPWVHVDLSCEDNKGGLGLVSSSTTAFGVRFGYELITASV